MNFFQPFQIGLEILYVYVFFFVFGFTNEIELNFCVQPRYSSFNFTEIRI